MKFKFVKAEPNEIQIIIDLLRDLYIELGEEEESTEFLTEKLIIDFLNSGVTQIYFAKSETGNVIGLVTLTESQSIYAGGKYGLLDEMYILPEYRSQSIGAEMIEHIKEIGLKSNWNRIDVTAPTEERWKRTVDFYEKCGFVFTGPKLKLKL